MRFDFTGLGESEGDFANTNFSSNVDDLVRAAEFLATNYNAPKIIIGHSLGGAAVVFAASKIETVTAVVTIGAPANPQHVQHLVKSGEQEIEANGEAIVQIGGRDIKIKKQFLQDIQEQNMQVAVKRMEKALLVMHSPQDTTVEIENAAKIYRAGWHPKSFVSLDGADHLLSEKKDSVYVGQMIAAWRMHYQ